MSDPETPTGPAERSEDDGGTERTTIRRGRDYEEAFRLDAAEAGRFLVEVGEQLQKGDELTLTTDEWELPFAFGEPVELEVDFDGVEDPELEIEVELPGRTDERAPSVE
jgi:amphi-Trp domain-containing protein